MATKHYTLRQVISTGGTQIDLPSVAGDVRIKNVGDYNIQYRIGAPVDANAIVLVVGENRQIGQFDPSLINFQAIDTDSEIEIEALLRNPQ